MAKRMFDTWGPRLGITEDESDHACREALQGAHACSRTTSQDKGRAILETVEAEDRVAHPAARAPVPLGPGPQPRHPRGVPGPRLSDPLASARSRRTREYLDRYFKEELASGQIKTPLELNHVWPENYSVNSAQKVWGAVFAAHHPNVVVLDLSSFKCGHDAPIYGLIDSIIEKSKTPYAALHDIDANKPGGSIKIRVKTYAHALKLHEERLQDASKKVHELAHAIDQKRLELLELKAKQLSERARAGLTLLRLQIEALREKVARLRAASALPTARAQRQGHGEAREEERRTGRSPRRSSAPATSQVHRDGRCSPSPPMNVRSAAEVSHGEDHEQRTQRRHHRDQRQEEASRSLSQDMDLDAELSEVRGGGAQAPRPRRQRPSSGSRTWSSLGFTKSERAKVTLLIGGLTARARLPASRVRSRASATSVQMLDVPDDRGASRRGKEFGNRGQCNPTYFTVGNLVQYLITLRDKHGMTSEDIVDEVSSSSRPARAVPAASACTSPSTARRSVTPASTASASCSSSRRAASSRRPATTSASS